MSRIISKSKLALSVVVAIAALAFSSQRAGATIILTNGDFELPGTDVAATFPQGVPSWGENHNGVNTFRDFLIVGGGTHGAYLDGQTAGINNVVTGNGHLYQEIGTSDGSPTVNVSGLNFWRNEASNQHGPLLVEMYWLPAAHGFSFSEVGNDILGTGTLISSTTVADPVAQNATTPFSIDFDVSSLAGDARLFLRFDAIGDTFAYVDEVSASAAPEPSMLWLLSGTAIALAAARRRRVV